MRASITADAFNEACREFWRITLDEYTGGSWRIACGAACIARAEPQIAVVLAELTARGALTDRSGIA